MNETATKKCFSDIGAVIFDLDGTLIDSEKNYEKADSAFLAQFGVDFPKHLEHRFLGKGTEELIHWLKEIREVNEPMETLIRRKNEYYLTYAEENTEVFPEMKHLVRELYAKSFPMAIASASPYPIIRKMLSITGMEGYFHTLISVDHVARGKPAPDVFLKAAFELNVSPRYCLAFEDSAHGVEAVLHAGMKCVAIPTLHGPMMDPVFREADLLFPEGMKDFKASEILYHLDCA